MKNDYNRLKHIFNNHKEGFTITKNLNPIHKKGFCVSITNNKGKDLKKLFFNLLNNEIDLKKLKLKSLSSLYVGGWLDSKTDLFYLDYSLIVKNKEKALSIAKAFNQKAIFSLYDYESIYL